MLRGLKEIVNVMGLNFAWHIINTYQCPSCNYYITLGVKEVEACCSR